MNKEIKVGTVGGDLRSLVCAKKLAELGIESAVYGFEKCDGNFGDTTKALGIDDAVSNADAIILPLPPCSNGVALNAPFSDKEVFLTDILKKADKKSILIGGNVSKQVKSLAQKEGFEIYDYFDREEVKTAFAIPTVEGALAIAVNETPFTLNESLSLVLGYGRIGKLLCKALKNSGSNVYAAARKLEDFAWIKANGYTPVHINDIRNIATKCNIIFNTIPSMVIGKELLEVISKETLIIDLASKPGGVDFEAAKALGLNVIWALALPGKTAPLTSGNIMFESILNIFQEKGLYTI